MQYIGDFKENEIIYFMFNTFTSDDPSASCTISNFISTDIHIHKDDGLTQRCNAAGITVSIDFDGITGSHLIKIDSSDNTVAGFFVTGADYFVRIEGTSVDAATINAVVGHFSIENRYTRGTDSAALAATALSDATWTDAKAVHLDANISSRNATTPPTVAAIRQEMDANSTRLDADVSSRNATTPPTVGAIRTEMEGAGTKLTLALEDTADLQGNQAAWATATGFSTHDAAAVKTAMEAAGSKLTLTLEDTADLQGNQAAWATATGFSTHTAANVWAAAARTLTANTNFNDLDAAAIKAEAVAALADIKLDHLLNIAVDTDWGTTVHLDSVIGHMADVGGAATYDRANESMEALRARGDAAWDTATGFSTHSAADVWTSATRALTDKTGFALSAAGANLILKDSLFALAIADAMWDEILTGATHNIATSAGRRVREIGAFAIQSGTAQAGNGHSITLAATASADDGVYNRNLIVLTDNTGVGQTRTIVDYDGTSKIAIIDRDWRVSPDATTSYQIVPDDTPLVVDHGLARAGTSTTIQLRAYASAVDDTYLCNIIAIIAGTGRGQTRLVGSYDGTSKIVTICGDDWVTTPDTTSVYTMLPYGTTCTSCIGDHALGLIKSEADDALSDVSLHTHDQNMKALIMSDY